MFPVLLDLSMIRVALIGGGDRALNRLKQLDESGVRDIKIFADNFSKEFWEQAGDRIVTKLPDEATLKNFKLVMIVDIPDEKAAELANMARRLGIIVNVEDNKEFCDFYFPSIVRRGDLTIAINTNGKSPALASRIRKTLEKLFPSVWRERLNYLAEEREKWKAIGLNNREIITLTNDVIDNKSWLDEKSLTRLLKEELADADVA